MNCINSEIGALSRSIHKCDAEEIYIEREWDSWRLAKDYLEIGKNMMDEFSNYYRFWDTVEVGMFDENGEFIRR